MQDPETNPTEPKPDETPIEVITIGDDATTETDGASEPEKADTTE